MTTVVQHVGVLTFEQGAELDHLEWATLQKLGAIGPSPGTAKGIICAALVVLSNARQRPGSIFANPRFTVTTSEGPILPAFIHQARRAQIIWLRQLAHILGSAGAMKRALKRVDPITRQLAYTGVLFINGQHIHPAAWPCPDLPSDPIREVRD